MSWSMGAGVQSRETESKREEGDGARFLLFAHFRGQMLSLSLPLCHRRRQTICPRHSFLLVSVFLVCLRRKAAPTLASVSRVFPSVSSFAFNHCSTHARAHLHLS